jgi:PAS domain S-box-containing protein
MGRLLKENKAVLAGIACAILYWIIESGLDTLVHDHTYVRRLLPLGDPNELWMRVVSVGILLGFAVSVQVLGNKRRRVQERHSQLAAIVESSDEAIVGCALDGAVKSWNPAAERLLGYPAGEMIGRTVFVLFPPDRQGELSDGLEEVGRGRSVFMDEAVWLKKGGEEVWTSASLSPTRDLGGRIVGVSIIARDVTERRRTREALRRQKELYETMLNAQSELGVGFVITSGKRIVYANEAYCGIIGYSAEELMAMTSSVETLAADEEKTTLLENADRRLTGREAPEHYETALRRKDGRRVDVEVSLKSLEAETGTQFVAIVRDITGRKRDQEELKARALQQAAVAQLGQRALGQADLPALMDEAVALTAKTLGGDFCEVLELLPEGDALLLRSGVGWEEGLAGYATLGSDLGSQIGYTLLLREPVVVEDLREDERFDGPALFTDHGVVGGMSVVIQGRDRPFGVLGVHTRRRRSFSGDDINFLRAVANVLAVAIARGRAEEALLEAQEGERRRIARDLHDLVLQDLTDTLRALQDTQLRSENLGQNVDLEQEIGALRRTVGGLRGAIYDLRQSEGRSFVWAVRSLVEMDRRMAPERTAELVVEDDFPTELPDGVATELLRIIQEALTNSRRHSGAANVRVVLRRGEEEASLEVYDDGRGFDPDAATGGVGLAGMRERALALGGSLEVEGRPGGGATVRFRAPLSALVETRPESWVPAEPVALEGDDGGMAGEEAVRKRRVLLVEDHVSFRQSLAMTLAAHPGFALVGQVGSLVGAREAMGKVGEEIDLAIIDLTLPDGTGTELIRELHEASPRASVLVLTASLDRQQYAWAVEAGAAGVLHKSASIDSIIRALNRLGAGESLLPPSEVVELLRLALRQRKRDEEARSRVGLLTRRELEVLNLLAEGLDGREISRRLDITPKTEHTHMTKIFGKLGVHSRLEALVFAVRHGLVDIPTTSSAEEPSQKT